MVPKDIFSNKDDKEGNPHNTQIYCEYSLTFERNGIAYHSHTHSGSSTLIEEIKVMNEAKKEDIQYLKPGKSVCTVRDKMSNKYHVKLNYN